LPFRGNTVTASKQLLLADALDLGFAPLLCPTYSDLRDEAVRACRPASRKPASFAEHAQGVSRWTQQLLDRIQALHDAAKLFNARYSNAIDEAERRLAIIDFARQLGATPRQLRSDRKALDSYFDGDAVQERYRHRVGERERALGYALDRLGVVAARALADGEVTAASPLLSKTVANILATGRNYRGDSRVRLAAHQSLLHMVQNAPTRLGA
jgi:gamma-polyglutamate synthase